MGGPHDRTRGTRSCSVGFNIGQSRFSQLLSADAADWELLYLKRVLCKSEDSLNSRGLETTADDLAHTFLINALGDAYFSDSGFVIIAGVLLLTASISANSLFNHFGSIPEVLSLHGSSQLKKLMYDCISCISSR